MMMGSNTIKLLMIHPLVLLSMAMMTMSDMFKMINKYNNNNTMTRQIMINTSKTMFKSLMLNSNDWSD